MTDAILGILKDLMTTKGRIPRSTFWWFHGILLAVLLFFGFLLESKVISESSSGIFGLLMLPLLIMRIIVEIKRWHDRDKSGWWVLIGIIPCVGFLWVLIECGFLPGTKGENRFGPDPSQV